MAEGAEEQPRVPQKTAQDSRRSHRGLHCLIDVQAAPKIRAMPVATRNQPDLVKSRAECTHLQHAAEHGTRTLMSGLNELKGRDHCPIRAPLCVQCPDAESNRHNSRRKYGQKHQLNTIQMSTNKIQEAGIVFNLYMHYYSQ